MIKICVAETFGCVRSDALCVCYYIVRFTVV